jgi:hypothetical protein
MTSERRVAFGIFALIAILIGGGAFYFFGVYRPKQEKSSARDEVEAWEKRWQDARKCLIGATPQASKPGQALAILRCPGVGGKCARDRQAVTRRRAPNTGIMEVKVRGPTSTGRRRSSAARSRVGGQ